MNNQSAKQTQVDLDDYLKEKVWSAQSGPADARFSVSMVAIASGARPIGAGKFELSITLLMQPVQGGDGWLPKLPATIAEWAAGGIELLIDAREKQSLTPSASLPPRKVAVVDLGGADQRVESLWQRLMAPKLPDQDVDWWKILAEELHTTGGGGEGNPPTPPGKEPPVVRVPRGSAAVSIALRRAKQVRTRTAGILNPGRRAEIDVMRTAMLDRGGEHLMIDPPYRVAGGTGSAARLAQEGSAAKLAQGALDRARRWAVESLKPEVTRAHEIAHQEREYAAGASDDQKLRTLLKRQNSPAGQIPADICKAVEGADLAFCHALNEEHRALHFAASDHGKNVADGDSFNDKLGVEQDVTPEEAAQKAVQRRLHVLEGLPRLSRLFNLVVEATVEVDPAELRGGVAPSGDMFVSLAARFVSAGRNEELAPVWTRAKLTLSGAPQFWPCTQEEIDAARLDGDCIDRYRTVISQRYGIVDLGVVDSEEGRVDPRFDLICVDPVAGVEAEINQELANVADSDASDATDPAFVTLRTAGLCLVDRWRQEDAIKMSTRAARLRQGKLGGQVLDADLLQVGWRVDVGVRPTGAQQTVWRSLCNRMIDLHDPASPLGDAGTPCGSWVEAKLADRDAGLSENERRAKRIRLDGSYVSAPLRLNEHKIEENNLAEPVLHADDLIAQWEGDPLGIECNRHLVFARPKDDLAIMQVHKPLGGNALGGSLPPPLRFGQRYRFGARVVYRGGVVQPLDKAVALYRTLMDGTAVLPADTDEREGRAFRRHERIGPITVTQTRARIEMRLGNRYWLPESFLAVLRTAEVEREGNPQKIAQDDSLGTIDERRILVAPGVGLAFATLHGIFDHLPQGGIVRDAGRSRPRDGLADVLYATRPLGGFPVLARNGKILAEIHKSFDQETGAIELVDEGLRGDAIFQTAKGGGGNALARPMPYYPDPAARFMVIRAASTLRGPVFSDQNSRPVLVPLYKEGIAAYPDAMPVVLDIRREASANVNAPDTRRQADIIVFSENDGTGYLDEKEQFYRSDSWPAGKTGPKVPVRRVFVQLQPGDDITLEIWCIPDIDRLTHWFDVVESGALLLAAGNADIAKDPYVCIRKLSEETGCRMTPAPANDPAGDKIACGMGGMRTPSQDTVKEWAAQLHDALQRAPVPEVASVQKIRAVHAVSRPRAAPAFDKPLTYVRCNWDRPGQLTRRQFVENHTDDLAAWRPRMVGRERKDGLDDEGATDVMFAGTVQADLDTSDTVTLWGRFASPETDQLDDDRRGFSEEQLKRYEHEKSGDKEKLDLSKDSSIFGFFVAADGRVTFPEEQKVRLMTIHGLVPTLKRRNGAREEVDLLVDLKSKDEDKARPKPRAWRYTFKGNIARRVSISLESKGRFEPYFKWTTLARLGEAEKWRKKAEKTNVADRPTTPWVDAWTEPEHLAQMRTSAENINEVAKSLDLWIDATCRPARIEPKSLLPMFVWTIESGSIKRQTRVRLRFKRPWFSSGQDERLGVVIWPPQLFSMTPGQIARYSEEARPVALAFSDAALGSGGGFVTRWGSDPIRKGATPDGWLVPREVFVDHGTPRSRLVENVLMPLPADDMAPAAPATTVSSVTDPRQTMRVSLMTYEPLFDPIQALWYVDLALDPLDVPDPFMRLGLVRYQEHAPGHLQVSEPVAEWVQLLPTRFVSWKYGNLQSGERGVPIEIKVRGQGSLRAALEDRDETRLLTDDEKLAEETRQALRDRPIMRAQVSKRRRIRDGLLEEQAVIGADGKLTVDANAQRSSDGLTWTLRFLLPAEDDPDTSYHVSVEEVVQMRPASGTPDDVETPRFFVTLDLHKN